MSISLSAADGLPCRQVGTVSGANNVIVVEIDRRIRRISIRPVGADGLLSLDASLAHGAPISGDPLPGVPLDADSWNEFAVARDPAAGVEAVRRIAVTSATNGTVFHFWGSLE